MEIYYSIIFFLFGMIFGSFFNVVGYRLPKKESLLFPASHCPNCHHKLQPPELVPIFSYLFLKGKCKNCKQKIPLFYPIFELLTGILFVFTYLQFGLTMDCLIALVLISTLIVVIISDSQTMIIPDELLIFSGIILSILITIHTGWNGFLHAFLNGFIAFLIMYLLKKFGDILFKKESMGGGDIKLMFLFGLVLGWKMTLVGIFFASFIGLPISLFILYFKKSNVIPFGPFLSISAIILLLSKIDFSFIINMLTI